MGRYTKEIQLADLAKESLYMHKQWEVRYLTLMMTQISGDKCLDMHIDRAKEISDYWLDKYTRIMKRLNAN